MKECFEIQKLILSLIKSNLKIDLILVSFDLDDHQKDIYLRNRTECSVRLYHE